MNTRLFVFAALMGVAAASRADIIFSNFTYGPGAVVAGFSGGPTITGNALNWQPGNAVVGDTSTLRSLTIALTYDARSTGGNIASVLGSVNNTAQGFVAGSGLIAFQEDVFELDAQGNEVGLAIGTAKTNTLATGTLAPTSISLSRQVSAIRVKKSFFLAAPATAAFDYAGIGQVNQSVEAVPEPATMAALGLGAVAMLRRRKRA